MLFATAELGRSKLRFGSLTLGAGLLVFVLLFQQALLTSLLDGMSGALSQQSGSVLVYHREARRSLASSLIPPELADQVAEHPDVAETGALAVTALSFRPPDTVEPVNMTLFGFTPGQPGAPTGLQKGRLPESGDEVVVSGEDAQGFGVGDTIVVEPGGYSLEVVGLTSGGRWGMGATLWTPYATYEQLLRLAFPEAALVVPAAVAVQPAAGVSPEALAASLNESLPELEALTRSDAVTKAPGRGAIQIAFGTVIGLGYLVVAVVIGFFFLTMTLHKESSLTLMRAVGTRSGYLIRCLLLQVAVVTLGGLALGVLLMLAAAPAVRSAIVVSVDLSVVASTAVPALAVALLGAIPPLRRVLRIEPNAVVSRPGLGGWS